MGTKNLSQINPSVYKYKVKDTSMASSSSIKVDPRVKTGNDCTAVNDKVRASTADIKGVEIISKYSLLVSLS